MKLSRTLLNSVQVYQPDRKQVVGKVTKYNSFIRSGVFSGDIINHETVFDMGYRGTTDVMSVTTSYSNPKDIITVGQGKIVLYVFENGDVDKIFVDASEPMMVVVPIKEGLSYGVVSLSSSTVITVKRTYKTFSISYEDITPHLK